MHAALIAAREVGVLRLKPLDLTRDKHGGRRHSPGSRRGDFHCEAA